MKKTFWAYLNTWLNRLYKTLAVLLVLMAVLLTSARIFLPHAHTFKNNLEDYINSVYQGEIEIGELSAGWHKFGPTLVVKQVVLSDSEALKVEIDEIDIGLDFWGTLKTQQVKANNFTLVGASIKIDQTVIIDAGTKKQTSEEADIDAFSDLILNQFKRFSVRDSKILIKTLRRERTILLNKLAWHNDGNNHKGIGKLEIEGFSSNSAKLLIDLQGDKRENLKGKIYIEGNNINLAPWFDKHLKEKADQFSTEVNFSSWMNVAGGYFTDLHINLGENTFAWDSFEQQHVLKIPEGNVSIYRDGQSSNYSMQTSNIEVLFNEAPWTEFQLQATSTPTESLTNISTVSLDNLWQLFPIIKDNIPEFEKYSSLQLSGDLTNIQIRTSAEKLQLALNLDDVGWNAANGIPGIEQISGRLLFDNDQIQLDVTSENNEIDFDGGFSRPIPFNDLKATVNANWSERFWKLAVSDVFLSSDELSVTANVQFLQEVDQSGVLSLYAYAEQGDASKAQYYLPLPVMSESLVEYLTAAIFHGDVKQAGVLFNGPVATFPFTDNSGIFIVDADVEQAKYQFEQSWPAIEKAHLNLNFTNDSMLITAYDGDLMGIQTKDVVVGIESLSGDSILTVRTPVTTEVTNVTNLMVASPMAESVGETLTLINPKGQVKGTFSLDLPLGDTEKVVAKGIINFANNEVFLQAPEMNFSHVNGQLSFNNELITTKDISLNWRGMPINLNVDGRIEDDYYQVDIDLLANWQKQHYDPQIPENLRSYVNGQLDWQGKLSLFIPEEGELSYDFNLDSNLENAILSLPEPYFKPAEKQALLKASAKGGANKSTIEATLDENLRFYGELDHQKIAFLRTQLVLGKEKMLLPTDGFHITTDLDSIVYQPWHEFIFDIINSIPDGSGVDSSSEPAEEKLAFLQAPERIRGNIKNVDLFGQTLTDVDFNLLAKEQWWLLQLNADQARSRMKFFHDFQQNGLEVDADFIHLTDVPETNEVSDEEETASQISPADIPKVKFNCDSCKYQQLDFGKVLFELENTSSTVATLRSFSAKRKNSDLSLSGVWQKDDEQNKTSISGAFNSKDIEKEINKFDMESGIKDSGLKSSYDFNWQGGPHEFNLASLNGQYNFKFDDGYLADVSDKGARLLSIFSFQSLVRKLTLDFRDIFSEGMFYDDIKGKITLVNGVAYTDNTKMNGAAGNLTVKGNTNLVTNKLDYKMSFAPKVTSSLPIIVGWLVNPLMGAAIMVADEAIQKAEVISVINFELTGSVDEPIFKEVDRKSRDVSVGKSKPDKPKAVEGKSEADASGVTGAENKLQSSDVENKALPEKKQDAKNG
ncbi:YhdP family protein [Thalassotalea nanhaiensis]|uniref:YhdP family protein n=1 Tax=Thalassotalea nanhaiensis TaxID=3065648 RepID=A0ABY9TI93_9GAMM|nr:YhdP family protein [Colwelliaceae bacterium SQ345]